MIFADLHIGDTFSFVRHSRQEDESHKPPFTRVSRLEYRSGDHVFKVASLTIPVRKENPYEQG